MREYPKGTLAKVKIKTQEIDISIDDISPSTAENIIADLIKNHPEDKWFQEKIGGCIGDSFGFTGTSQGGNNISISTYLKREITKEEVKCPRNPGFGPLTKGPHYWNKVGDDRVCGYCGSLHPEDLLKLVKERGPQIIQRTDKDYKIYVNRPEVPNASFGAIKFYTPHLSKEQLDELNRLIFE